MRKEILLFVSLSACVLHFAGVPRQPHPQAVEGGDEVRLPPGAGEDWWSRVQADIRAEEYHVTWQDGAEGLPAGYAAPNRAQGFRTFFSGDGVRLVPSAGDGPGWEWGLSLVDATAEGRRGGPGLYVSGNRVEVDRGWVTEWFVNSPEGLEQGFTVPTPPVDRAPIPSSGRVGNSPSLASALPTDRPSVGNGASPLLPTLHIDLAVTGTLHPKFAEDGQAVDFYEPGGNVAVLRYAKLTVTDATGRELPARFEVWCGSPSSSFIPHPSSAANGGIRISIDDADAVYPITVDPLATSPAWTAVGEGTNNHFGFSVATAGDVNGDGYSDVIVGAPYYDNGSNSDAGKAYLYLGGPSGLSATAAWTKVGEGIFNYFGCSVATAGDVNGDGYSDVVIGAYGNYSYRGKAYLYLGGPSGLSGAAAWTRVGEVTFDLFGSSVATAGDVNGDGYSDVVVGASAYTSYTGKAYLYLGGPSGLSGAAAWTATGENTENYFGDSVATAGDVNGDGYSDVVVGAWGYASATGRAYLYLGGPSGLSGAAAWTATGETVTNYLGGPVATAGDVNGDGYADVVVGAFNYGSGIGKVYLYLGGSSGLSTTAAWTKTGEGVENQFGASVATAGDVNGDGYSDVIIGANKYAAFTGRAYLYMGGPSGLSAVAAWTVTGQNPNDSFGIPVVTAGDVNGDGYSDVVVAADQYATKTGKAYLYLGGPSGLSATSGWATTGEAVNIYFGYSAAAAGDVNGDGYSDVVVGAQNYASNTGKAYLYLGGPSGLGTTAAWTALGEGTNNAFGYSVATAGDVNGDGYSDVVVGARNYNTNTGKAYLYLGGPSGLGAAAAWTAVGEGEADDFGFSVATAGDVNGDGYSDVVIGASMDLAYTGRAYLYMGGPSGLSATAAWSAAGEGTNQYFGCSVATAGDVNRDGYSDVAVAAYSWSSNTGKAYVYLGGPTGLSAAAAWTAAGEVASDYFGRSVAAAGDVNGDGYSDVVVGADGYASSAGKAYVYLGGASGLSATAGWTATGEGTSNFFGNSVATAGDVNVDGYSDVVVGAQNYASNTGKAYLYLGGPAGLGTTSAWTAVGEGTGNNFGYPVAAAGDVNGDGYSDVVIGAYGYATSSGKTYLYYGNGGPGIPVRPQQRRSDDGAPVDKLGKSDSTTSFRLASLGRTPLGRGDVKLELEVKPLGTLFDGTGTQLAASWTDSGVSGAALNELVSSLTLGTNYHWRARLHYNPATMPFQARSRWFTQPWDGWQEADLRTAPACAAPTSLTNNTAADEDLCGDTGVRVTWMQDAGVWGDGGGWRTYDIFRDGIPLQSGIAYGSTEFTDTTGTNGTAYTYTVRYNNGCGMSAVTSGASADDTEGPPELTPLYLRKDPYSAGIVSAWHMDEGAGLTAADTPGSNDGTLVNGPVWTTGHSGKALSFDGTNDHVSVPSQPSLNPAQITVAAWIKADTWTAESWRGSIVAKDSESPVSGWVLRCGNGGRLSFVVVVGGGWCYNETAALMTTGTWTHVAGTYDGTTLRIYINGVERASAGCPGSITPSTVPVLIGASGFAGRLFDGTIDDAAVFNRALSGPEIQDLYQWGFPIMAFEWTPLVPAPDTYEILRAATADGTFDTTVATVGGTSGSTVVNIGSQPANAYYKIRAVKGSCPGPM